MRRSKSPAPEESGNFFQVWKELLIYSKKYAVILIVALLFAAGGNLLTVIGPNYIGELTNIIENGLGGTINMNAITRIGWILLTLYGLSGILSLFQGLIMVTVTQRISQSLRADISSKINRLPMAYFSNTTVGDTLSRVTNDVTTVSQSLNNSVRNLVTSGTMMIGSLVMMLLTNGWMTLTAIGATLIGVVLMGLIMKNSQGHFVKQQNKLGEVNGQIEEIYSGHAIVKAYNGEREARTDFSQMNHELRDSGFKAQALSGLMRPIMIFIGNFGYVAVCVVGAALTIAGNISFGVVVAFIMYVRYFTQPLAQIAQSFQSLQSAAAAGERVFELLNAKEMKDESEKSTSLNNVDGLVEFSNVQFSYDDTTDSVIKNFSAKAEPGQKIAIVGHTGAGKTTIVNLLMRFYEIDEGEITIDGTSIHDITRANVHDQFCMVLQDTWIFEGTVRENLVYNTKNVSEETLTQAGEAVGVDHFIQTLPNGYDTVLDDQVNLSHGQKQQLTIARAIIADKPMLILDEATSSVDTRTEIKIQEAMDSLMEGRTSFVIAHRLSTIKNADTILVMEDGDIIESGSHDVLIAQNGVYHDLYNSQFDHVG